MTHIIRKQAMQAGYVPQHSYAPHEIFDAAVLEKSPVVYPQIDTPQSEEPIRYECRDCSAVLFEDELDDHECDSYEGLGE